MDICISGLIVHEFNENKTPKMILQYIGERKDFSLRQVYNYWVFDAIVYNGNGFIYCEVGRPAHSFVVVNKGFLFPSKFSGTC